MSPIMQQQRAGDAVGAGEVGEVVLAERGRAGRGRARCSSSAGCAARRRRGCWRGWRRPSCSRPRPSEWRRSISAASCGWLVTIARPRSFSHQRNAGMSSLLPCSSPAWQAPVCEDQSVSQRCSRCVPVAQPARERRHVAVAHRAPQHVVGEAVDLEEDRRPGRPCACTAPRPARLAQDDVAVVEVVVVDRQQRRRPAWSTTVIPIATTIPEPSPSTSTPGSIAATPQDHQRR